MSANYGRGNSALSNYRSFFTYYKFLTSILKGSDKTKNTSLKHIV